ncbi:MAG: ATP-dependent DNA helicase RecG [Anaerolineaceae bacterium]
MIIWSKDIEHKHKQIMRSITEKYFKIFKLEGEQGYENRAVMGGMQRLAEAWPAEAREAGFSESLIPVVSSILSHYKNLNVADRRAALLEVGDILEIPNISSLQPVGSSVFVRKGNNNAAEAAKMTVTSGNSRTQHQTGKGTDGKMDEKVGRAKVNARLKDIAHQPMANDSAGLDAPISVIRGVGEKQAKHLQKLGIYSIKDLLYLFPRRYDDYSKLKTIQQLRFGEEVTIIAQVLDLKLYPTKGGRKITEAVVSDTTGTLRLLWFNQDYHRRYLRAGMFISISGKIDTYLGRPVMFHPDYEPIDQQQVNTNRIVPVYPLTALITQRWLRRTQFNTVQYWAARAQDFLPQAIQEQAEVIGTQEALKQIHFPDSQEDLRRAQNRFAFEEIFLLQLGVIRQKRQWQQLEGTAYQVTDAWLEDRLKSLPYRLTNAQTQALKDIRKDVGSKHPMNRLLQGDVGSGKTVVAVLGMCMVIESGAQAALMAPTSILAEQHFRNINKLLTESVGETPAFLQPGQVRLLTGDTSQSDRREILEGLKSGYVKLLVGTHALIEDPVTFQSLQMVVVDEQHRFGVQQRAALRSKGNNPHLLVMTATPIPRSLQLTVFGDLDVSLMDEVPEGRLPIETQIVFPMERERIYKMIELQVNKGYQAFIIYPLVEQGENEEAKAAVEEQQRLQSEAFPHLRVGLVHGRMKPAEKDSIMLGFRNKEYDILVSTSVVEVGVDIPNATMMIIEGANRFGLAQLHQFRGRVGRGTAQSYCFLIPESESAAENERLLVMTQTNDGFVLAEKDLEQRGPGDFLGTRQAGYVDLKMANLADIRLIQKARTIAEIVYNSDPELSSEENLPLKRAVENFWPSMDGSGDVS